MKKTLYIFLSLLFINPCFSQYTVTKVIGSVKKKLTGEALKPGSKFNDTDPLVWSSPNDMVRTIVAGKGIFMIMPSPKAEKEGSSLLEIVKFTLHLKSKEGNLSGRGEDIELLPEALRTEAGINTKNLIARENKYLFDKKVYDVSGGNKFFLQIELPGSDPVIKSLQVNSDTVVLYSSDFKKFSLKDAGNAKYKLGFFSKKNNSSKPLIQINPYFDSTAEMETIMKIIISEDKQRDEQKLQEQCYAEIYEALGKPSDILFKNVFGKIFTSSVKNSVIKNKLPKKGSTKK
jgi:hypothetical protein